MTRAILLVEDNRPLSEALAEALSQEGYRCFQAFDGEEALAAVAREAPVALVLDLNIPVIHGLEVLRRVKAERPDTVVVVLTGHGSDQTALQAMQWGADDYLTKPVRLARLAECLETHLARAAGCRAADDRTPGAEAPDPAHLARVFDEAPAALVHVDATGAVRAVNRWAARLLAQPPADLLGRDIGALLAPGHEAPWLGAVRREAGGPRGYEGELSLDGPGGPLPVSVVATERPDAGHLIFSLRDLTRQKALEKRFFESKRLSSLGRVVEGVAHEVRNPLLSIGGFARKLREVAGEGGREGVYLDVIFAEVERLEQMVRDIEEYVQFSKHRKLSCEAVDLAGLLRDCAAALGERSGRLGIHTQWGDFGDLPTLYADPALLTELFVGLLDNAVEAMPDGGVLKIQCQMADNWVVTRVQDTGVGIPEKDLAEVFDPFFTSKTSGAGLGLAKAYLIVEDHSGTIDFDSRVGEGTTCTVTLPIERRRMPRSRG